MAKNHKLFENQEHGLLVCSIVVSEKFNLKIHP